MGPEMFSVHGIARRTNNNIENFHGRLKEKFQVSHPNLWTFLSIYKFIIVITRYIMWFSFYISNTFLLFL